METTNKIYVEQMAFSTAMIELKNHTQKLINLEEIFEEPNLYLEQALRQEKSEAMAKSLKTNALDVYYAAEKLLMRIKKDILTYEIKLEKFLKNNPESYEKFYAQLDILIPLYEESKNFVEGQIAKCNAYLNPSQDILL